MSATVDIQPLEDALKLLDDFVPSVNKQLIEHMYLGLKICDIDCVTTDAGDNAYTFYPSDALLEFFSTHRASNVKSVAV